MILLQIEVPQVGGGPSAGWSAAAARAGWHLHREFSIVLNWCYTGCKDNPKFARTSELVVAQIKVVQRRAVAQLRRNVAW